MQRSPTEGQKGQRSFSQKIREMKRKGKCLQEKGDRENREAAGLLLVMWARQRLRERKVCHRQQKAVGCRPALVMEQ